MEGKPLVKKIKKKCLAFKNLYLINNPLHMTIINFDDSTGAMASYIASIQKHCMDINIKLHIKTLSPTLSEAAFIDIIKSLNHDPLINGYIITLPLPATISMHNINQYIDPRKDVDGCAGINLGRLIKKTPLIVPATAGAVVSLLKHYNITLSGAYVVIVGASIQVGKPLANLLLHEDATVTICNKLTTNLKTYTQQADILIVAVGKINLINGDMIKPGSVIVDVGINYNKQNKMVGDVDFDDVFNKVKCSITPVPGGVGLVTTIMVVVNLLKLYIEQKNLPMYDFD